MCAQEGHCGFPRKQLCLPNTVRATASAGPDDSLLLLNPIQHRARGRRDTFDSNTLAECSRPDSSLALLGVGASRRPNVSGGLFAAGLALFCGSNYAVAFAERKEVGRLAPLGGLCFMAGWLAMAL